MKGCLVGARGTGVILMASLDGGHGLAEGPDADVEVGCAADLLLKGGSEHYIERTEDWLSEFGSRGKPLNPLSTPTPMPSG